MKAIEFPEQTTVIAKNQPEYFPLPAHIDDMGTATFCWQLTWAERVSLLLTGKLWHQVMTFKQPLQPLRLSVDKPQLT